MSNAVQWGFSGLGFIVAGVGLCSRRLSKQMRVAAAAVGGLSAINAFHLMTKQREELPRSSYNRIRQSNSDEKIAFSDPDGVDTLNDSDEEVSSSYSGDIDVESDSDEQVSLQETVKHRHLSEDGQLLEWTTPGTPTLMLFGRGWRKTVPMHNITRHDDPTRPWTKEKYAEYCRLHPDDAVPLEPFPEKRWPTWSSWGSMYWLDVEPHSFSE